MFHIFLVTVRGHPHRRRPGHPSPTRTSRTSAADDVRERDREDNTRSSWAHIWGDDDAPMSHKAIADFIESEAHCELPVNHVLTRVGARVLSDRRRGLKDSDAIDMRIMALAVPYCDLVVTDSHMANVVTELHLDDKYGTKVLPAASAGLWAAASWVASAATVAKSPRR